MVEVSFVKPDEEQKTDELFYYCDDNIENSDNIDLMYAKAVTREKVSRATEKAASEGKTYSLFWKSETPANIWAVLQTCYKATTELDRLYDCRDIKNLKNQLSDILCDFRDAYDRLDDLCDHL